MKVLKWLLVVLGLTTIAVLALLTASNVQAQEALVGDWVLDAAASKSSVPQMSPTAGTLTITDAGGGRFKSASEVTVGGASGRSEITYAVDGKDYAVTATPAQPGAAITQSIERTSDTAYNSSIKINGQLVATALTEISRDKRTLTQTTTGLGQFAALSSTVVFQRK
jgi:hypothetical protein